MTPRKTLAEVRARIERQQNAETLYYAIENEEAADAEWLVGRYAGTPKVFTTLCRAPELEYESPLCAAACRQPQLALAMLIAGADPRRAPEGGSFLLHAACGEAERPADELADRLELFGELLEAGADPGEPTAWPCRSLPQKYKNSLAANLILESEGYSPFLECLLASPAFDRKIWPIWPDPPVAARDFACRMGIGWAVELLDAWDRWSPERRSWAAAVLRAPRRPAP